jgi:UDP-glucose 4-epimerase
LSLNYEVIVLDDLETGKLENISEFKDHNFRFIKGSIVDIEILRNVLKGVNHVLHQAALPSVARSVLDPIKTSETNVAGTLNVLKASLDAGVEKVILASSSSVYGDTPELPKKESMPCNPKSPYAVTKVIGEHYARVFYEIYGLKTVCLRYFNVYGPRQDPKSEYAAVIPRFIDFALKNGNLPIFGDGKQTRDFTFIGDVVEANLLAMEKEKADGKVLNIACGESISIEELAKMIIELTDSSSSIVYKEPRQGDVKDSLADVFLAEELLGYYPKYSLKDGLEKTLEWFKR